MRGRTFDRPKLRDRFTSRWNRVRDNLSRGHVVEPASVQSVRPLYPGARLRKQYRPKNPNREYGQRRAFRGVYSLQSRAALARVGYASAVKEARRVAGR